MRTLISLIAVVAAAATATVAIAAPAETAARRDALSVRGSSFGPILFDGRGFALYAFTRDARRVSRCDVACAAAWPPYLVSRKPVAGKGVRSKLIGTTRRKDGRLQVTYAGRPLYYYVGDREAGQVLCQNVDEFGGLWLVVRGSGALVR